MADESHEHDALPSYGQNGRDLILKVSSHSPAARHATPNFGACFALSGEICQSPFCLYEGTPVTR
jgi:hypothetical protein